MMERSLEALRLTLLINRRVHVVVDVNFGHVQCFFFFQMIPLEILKHYEQGANGKAYKSIGDRTHSIYSGARCCRASQLLGA